MKRFLFYKPSGWTNPGSIFTSCVLNFVNSDLDRIELTDAFRVRSIFSFCPRGKRVCKNHYLFQSSIKKRSKMNPPIQLYKFGTAYPEQRQQLLQFLQQFVPHYSHDYSYQQGAPQPRVSIKIESFAKVSYNFRLYLRIHLVHFTI